MPPLKYVSHVSRDESGELKYEWHYSSYSLFHFKLCALVCQHLDVCDLVVLVRPLSLRFLLSSILHSLERGGIDEAPVTMFCVSRLAPPS